VEAARPWTEDYTATTAVRGTNTALASPASALLTIYFVRAAINFATGFGIGCAYSGIGQLPHQRLMYHWLIERHAENRVVYLDLLNYFT
jgi:hypothetical protein